VYNQKDENDHSEISHIPGGKCGCFSTRHCISAFTSSAVLTPQDQSLYSMQENKKIKQIRYRFDDRIGGHKLGVQIEVLPFIMKKQLKISTQMHNQEDH
jgi:hypothetical protein